MLGWFKKKSFWDWLAENTARVQSKRAATEMATEITERFRRQYPGLFWEITANRVGAWGFTISADGDRAKFSDVERAAREAPEIPGWKVHAFRQRGSLDVKIRMGERILGVDDVWCSVEQIAGGVALTLWIADLDDVVAGAAVVLLDNVIGEYDAVMKVRELARRSLPQSTAARAELLPLRDLPAALDRIPSTH